MNMTSSPTPVRALKPWPGGDYAPADYQMGWVRLRNGREFNWMPRDDLRWKHATGDGSGEDVIAYEPSDTLPPPSNRPGWDEDGMCNDHGRFACPSCALATPPAIDAAVPAGARAEREDAGALPWAYGWFDDGGGKHALPYLPTVQTLRGVSTEAFPLYRHPAAAPKPASDTGAGLREAEKLAGDTEKLAGQATSIADARELRSYANGIRRGVALATDATDGATVASEAAGLRVALEPFLHAAEPIVSNARDQWDPDEWMKRLQKITVGQFRALHAAALNHPAPSGAAGEDTQGTFACPICGEDKPHHHTPAVVDAYQNKRSRT